MGTSRRSPGPTPAIDCALDHVMERFASGSLRWTRRPVVRENRAKKDSDVSYRCFFFFLVSFLLLLVSSYSFPLSEMPQWRSIVLAPPELDPREDNAAERPAILTAIWSRDDASVISASNDMALRVFDASMGGSSGASPMRHCLRRHTDSVYCLERSPVDDVIILSGAYDGRICLWDIERGVLVAQIRLDESILACELSDDGTQSALFGGSIRRSSYLVVDSRHSL